MQLPSGTSAVSPTTCHLCLPRMDSAQVAEHNRFHLFKCRKLGSFFNI